MLNASGKALDVLFCRINIRARVRRNDQASVEFAAFEGIGPYGISEQIDPFLKGFCNVLRLTDLVIAIRNRRAERFSTRRRRRGKPGNWPNLPNPRLSASDPSLPTN